jgi:putative SOS response-associated peptidase YedK
VCGRYELHASPAAIALAFGLEYPPDIAPRYNIAPMQQVPIVRVNAGGQRELHQVRWGLVPRWAKDPSIASRMINARAETVATKASFRTAYRWHRCLVPADGFYEWKRTAHGKQPMHIGMRDGTTFGLAGLYERWLSPDGEPLDTCTILTTDANALLRPLHDRMPVIVPPEDYERWLDHAEPDPRDLIRPYDPGRMRYHPVSTQVNSVRNDDAQCIESLATEAPQAPDAAVASEVEADEIDEAPAQARLF